MKVVIALGGNALLKRGEAMTAENQRKNIVQACKTVSRVGKRHQLIIGHGNGPQVGLLALEAEAYADKVPPYPFDILGAESQGMVGYMLVQELQNAMPEKKFACLLTRVEVDRDDPAIKNPTKFIGPVYAKEEAKRLAAEKGWQIKADGDYFRRVVPSPRPQSIVEIDAIRALVDQGVIVVASGGGGIPVLIEDQQFKGFEAVIDKDLCSSLMARELGADCLVLATDVKSVFINFGKPDAKAIKAANPKDLLAMNFAAGSIGPKVQATCEFALKTNQCAAIGALEDIDDLVEGRAGTIISNDIQGIVYYE